MNDMPLDLSQSVLQVQTLNPPHMHLRILAGPQSDPSRSAVPSWTPAGPQPEPPLLAPPPTTTTTTLCPS